MKLAAALAVMTMLAASARAEVLSNDPFDDALRSPKISIGALKIVGEDHPSPDLADFPILIEGKAPGLSAAWVEGSVRWLRPKDGLPLPRARLLLSVSVPPERVLVRWRGRVVQLQGGPDGSSVELFAPLLNAGSAAVEIDGKPAAMVRVGALPRAGAAHAIDHTCSP